MTTLVTGASGALGRRVVPMLSGAPIVPLDGTSAVPTHADRLVHLAAGDHDTLARRRMSALEVTEGALAAASAAGVNHLVVLSSAMVYGAWPNNSVPLTEDAPLRPDVGFAFATQLAMVEQMADAWRVAVPGRTVGVLRPALAVAAEGTTSVVRALVAGLGTRLDEDDPPSQFLHLDDLAAAVVLAHDEQLDGVFNVAPDGWVPGDTVRALAGRPPRLRLPSWLADPVADLRWRFQRGPIPPGLRSYARHPWPVANDRLRAAGWTPTTTNEQAYVEATEPKWWTMLTPKRKQELSLGAMGLLSAGLAAALVAAIRRARSRLRS